ncbi:MAG: MFS transporter [Inhella sp.]
MTAALHTRPALALGFGLAFVSAAGQSFFIGLFGPAVQASLSVNASTWGLLYGMATLAGGLAMFWLGAQVDRVRPVAALSLALGLLSVGAFLMSMAQGPAMLVLSLLCLRLGGQGLAGHLAIVMAARHSVARGRGVAIAAYGFIVGEALLPALVIALLGIGSWRALWMGVGLVIALGAWPLLSRWARALPPPQAQVQQPHAAAGRRRDLLREPRFRSALAVMLVPPVVVTAVFVQQGAIATRLGWHPGGAAWAMAGFAAAQALSTWLAGRWVDRHGARGLLRVYLWPLSAGLLLSALPWAASATTLPSWPWWCLFVSLGTTAGAQSVLSGALWVELFGLATVGRVRGVYAALMVLATAVAPVALGLALDGGSAALTPVAAVLAYVLIVTSVAARVLREPATKLLA